MSVYFAVLLPLVAFPIGVLLAHLANRRDERRELKHRLERALWLYRHELKALGFDRMAEEVERAAELVGRAKR